MSDDSSKVFDLVDPARRGFLKSVLAGAAFAAPVIATFSVESLTASSVHAMGGPNSVQNMSNQVCVSDLGYVGPSSFQAHVSTGVSYSSDAKRVNGQVTLTVSMNGYTANSICGQISLVPGASIQGVSISVDGRTAAQVSTSGAFMIYGSDLDTHGNNRGNNRANHLALCDLDELVDFIASGDGCCTVTGEYDGRSYSASGEIYPSANPV
jgi:hypothetical protein